MARVIIDPGHGGHTDAGGSTAAGVLARAGLVEKDWNLRLAHQVAARLGGLAALTRDGDVNLPLGARVEAARRAGAEVFLSLHGNDGETSAEAWVHERAGAGSLRLAHAMQHSLRGAPVRRGPMAVLAPEHHASRTAACLLEVGGLSHPPPVEAMAASISRGVRRHVYGDLYDPAANPSPYPRYFRDADALDEMARNYRGTDDRRVSTVNDALDVVDRLRRGTGTSAWRTLDRAAVATRLGKLVRNYRLFNQGVMPLCGPAAFFTMWTKRDPVAFARYACQLFETGRARIGSLDVAPSRRLLDQDYAAMRRKMGNNVTEQADWMVMGALRNNDDCLFVWQGDPDQSVAGITFPDELESWLHATGLYRRIDNEMGSSWAAFNSKGYPAASDIEFSPGLDVVCLINANMVADQIGAAYDGGFLSQFSNHYVVLNSEVVGDQKNNTVDFNVWSYGQDFYTKVQTVQRFADDYYGALICRMR